MISEAELKRYRGPSGNEGGETFRQYCGLSMWRPFDKARGAYRRGSGITASDVYRAIVAHGGPK